MKNLKYIPFYIMALLVFAMTSCARDFDEPELAEPKYVPDPSKKVISVKEFKAMYAELANDTNELIDGPYVLKATVVGNDIAGNIFKKLYVQDYDRANTQAPGNEGLYLGVDQNNVSNMYSVGQDVYVELEGLYAVRFAKDLQIGFGTTNANRIPWNTFKEHVKRNGWATPTKMAPRKVKISELTKDMANTLVTIENAVFDEGGKGYFITPGTEKDTEQLFSDGTGKLPVRTSSFFSAMKNVKVPKGTGTLTGIISIYNDNWQFYLRDTNDVGEFDGKEVVKPVEKGLIFQENFGKPVKEGTQWPTVANYKGYQSADKFKYTDPYDTMTTLRDLRGVGNIYFTNSSADKQGGFKIEGLPANQTKLVMVYEMMGQSEDPAMNFSGFIEVKADDKNIAIPNRAITRDSWSKITIALPDNTTSVEFYSGAKNPGGMRVANVKIYSNSDLTVDPVDPIDPIDPIDPVDPVEPVEKAAFKETFGKGEKSTDNKWLTIADYQAYDMKAPITYTDKSGKATVRNIKNGDDQNGNVWFPTGAETFFTIGGINTSELKKPILRFKLAGNVNKEGDTMDLNEMKVSINGNPLAVKSHTVDGGKKEGNVFFEFTFTEGIPVAESVVLEFSANLQKFGMRIDDIIIEEQK